jgi:hypothetical protein
MLGAKAEGVPSGIEQESPCLDDELLWGRREDAAVHDEGEERQLARGNDLPRAGTGRANDRLRDVSGSHGDRGAGTRRRPGVRRRRQLPCRFVEVTYDPFYLTRRIRKGLSATQRSVACRLVAFYDGPEDQ